jgi:26S proteasome regulatory subunit T5
MVLTDCFILQVDAIGTKRFDSELSGDREVQRTMLELLSQLDGFSSSDDVKVRRPGSGEKEGQRPACTF